MSEQILEPILSINKNLYIYLYGAFGRHNFGDLLFPHIILKLLQSYNINTSNVLLCDVLERDMTKYGGHHVHSVTMLFNNNVNVDCIIMVGGETYNCSITDAITMFEPEYSNIVNHQITLLNNNIKNPAYLINKDFFNNNIICIANSIGGLYNNNNKLANQKLIKYDYVSTRDSLYTSKSYDIVPDCAVLTKYFFNDKINFFTSNFDFMKNKYIALQINIELIKTINIDLLINISTYLNLPIYLFVAGTAFGHDSITAYINLIHNTPNIFIFNETNIWKICCLISNAYIVIGTSLHVRIISFCYSKIRFTLTTTIEQVTKHSQFIYSLDNIPYTYITPDNLFNSIQKYHNDIDNIIFYNNDNLNNAINKYLEHSSQWLKIIHQKQ